MHGCMHDKLGTHDVAMILMTSSAEESLPASSARGMNQGGSLAFATSSACALRAAGSSDSFLGALNVTLWANSAGISTEAIPANLDAMTSALPVAEGSDACLSRSSYNTDHNIEVGNCSAG